MKPRGIGRVFLDLTAKGAHPRMWYCAFCARQCWYPPLKVPYSRPEAKDSPGQLEVRYVSMCIDCVMGREGKRLKKKIALGEMTPKLCWCVVDGDLLLVDLEKELLDGKKEEEIQQTTRKETKAG